MSSKHKVTTNIMDLPASGEGCFIYKLYDDLGACFYVGQSKSLRSRLFDHLSRFEKMLHSFEYFEADEMDLNDLEAEEIIKETPRFNHTIPSNSVFVHTTALIKDISLILSDHRNIQKCDYLYHSAPNNAPDNNKKTRGYIRAHLADQIISDICKTIGYGETKD